MISRKHHLSCVRWSMIGFCALWEAVLLPVLTEQHYVRTILQIGIHVHSAVPAIGIVATAGFASAMMVDSPVRWYISRSVLIRTHANTTNNLHRWSFASAGCSCTHDRSCYRTHLRLCRCVRRLCISVDTRHSPVRWYIGRSVSISTNANTTNDLHWRSLASAGCPGPHFRSRTTELGLNMSWMYAEYALYNYASRMKSNAAYCIVVR